MHTIRKLILPSLLLVLYSHFALSYAYSNSCQRTVKERTLSCKAYRQTTSFTCGPSVVMSLMNYYGKLTTNKMTRETEMRISREMNASGEGTNPNQIMSWLSDNGFSVSSGECISSSLIERNIDKGIVTIVTYNRHWLLAKGYKKATDNSSPDMIYFADSSCGGTIALSAETVDTMWSMGAMKQGFCGIHSGFYIVATPNR